MSLDFSNLKSTPLSDMNLSGGAIQIVLDDLIYNSLQPIVLFSTCFDSQITYILAKAGYNNKRKHSALDRDKFISALVKYHVVEDRHKKFEVLKKSKIERFFLFSFLSNWLAATKNYKKLYSEFIVAKGNNKNKLDIELQSIESLVGINRDKLFCVIQIVESYKNAAEEFRNAIVTKYLKHAWKEAKKFMDMNKSRSFNFDDIYQNFVSAVSHAVDRYDSSKGALTSYINFWILREKTSDTFSFENGVAYSVPQGVKTQMAKGNYADQNFSVSLQQETEDGGSLSDMLPDTNLTPEQSIEASQHIDRIRKLAKLVDPQGLGRLYLDIDEYFSKRELKQATKHMLSNGIIPKGELVPYKNY